MNLTITQTDLITKEKALDLLRQAVEERGEDYIYKEAERGRGYSPDCRYVEDGSPSCLVGLVAYKYDPAVLDKIIERGVNDEGVDYALASTGILDLTPGAVEVLSAAQDAQDRGKTWGEALTAALLRDQDVTEDGNELND